MPLKAAGVDVEIVSGRGPVVAQPILSMSDVDKLPVLDSDIDGVMAGIGIIIDNLTSSQALIGFAGAPFTLASYLVEGGPSRNHEKTKSDDACTTGNMACLDAEVNPDDYSFFVHADIGWD